MSGGPSLRRLHVEGASAFPGYPSAVSAAGLLFLSGQRGGGLVFEDLPPEERIGRQGFWLADADEEAVAVDAWGAHDALDKVLAAAGATQDHMLRLRIWQKDKRFYPAFERVRLIRQPSPSASSGHSASAILGLGGRAIGLDGVAIAADQSDGGRTAIGQTRGAERPLTYYSLAARHGDFAFLAGHIPVKQEPGFPTIQGFEDVPEQGRGFATGRSHTDSRDGPIAAQAWYVYDQLKASLAKVGADLSQVVHCLVGLRDLRDLPMFHRIHRETFGPRGPALTVLEAGEVGHRNSHLVVEPTVYTGAEVELFDWDGPPPLAGPRARRAGGLVFVSGMLGVDAPGRITMDERHLPREAQALVRAVAGGGSTALAAQCWCALTNLQTALAAAGGSSEGLVKMTVFLRSPTDWLVFDALRSAVLGSHALPAIEAVAVPHPGPSSSCAVQIDAVAAI